MSAPALLDSISLDPSPVVEAYKRDVDRTLIQQNLLLSVEERVTKMLSALRLAEEIRRSRPVQR
jgi:hypothetical protein